MLRRLRGLASAAAIVAAAIASTSAASAPLSTGAKDDLQEAFSHVLKHARIARTEAEIAAGGSRGLRQLLQSRGITASFPDARSMSELLVQVEADRPAVPVAPDEDELLATIVEGMIATTGDKGELADKARLLGDRSGVGIIFKLIDNKPIIADLVDGSPASKLLQRGDRLLAINGLASDGLSVDEVAEAFRGKPGSPVVVEVARGASPPTQVTLTREAARSPALDVESRSIGSVGYLRLPRLTEEAPEAVRRALAALIGTAKDGVILDLRGNPGGLLDAAIAVPDLFIDSGRLASTIGRDPNDLQRYYAKPGDIGESVRLVVLVDAETALGAETVAAALQQSHRATVVGQPTHGLGLVHSIALLKSGERVIRLPTSMLLKPDDTPLGGAPVIPDLRIDASPSPTDKALDIAVRLLLAPQPRATAR